MSLIGQKTRSDYLEWDRLQLLISQLERDGETKFCLLISIGCYTGLRISDLLNLRWEQLIDQSKVNLIEKKTKKHRTVEIHPHLKEILDRLYANQPLEELVFINRFKTKSINVQYVNRRLKELFREYGIRGQYSSHFMRKTLGRRVWAANKYSEQSLILLSQLFNHSSIQTTKIYLGIREQEISNLYLTV